MQCNAPLIHDKLKCMWTFPDKMSTWELLNFHSTNDSKVSSFHSSLDRARRMYKITIKKSENKLADCKILWLSLWNWICLTRSIFYFFTMMMVVFVMFGELNFFYKGWWWWWWWCFFVCREQLSRHSLSSIMIFDVRAIVIHPPSTHNTRGI